jgi:hypothetical protein
VKKLIILAIQPVWYEKNSEYYERLSRKSTERTHEVESGPDWFVSLEKLYSNNYYRVDKLFDAIEEDKALGIYKAHAYLVEDRTLSLFCFIFQVEPQAFDSERMAALSLPGALNRLRAMFTLDERDERLAWVKDSIRKAETLRHAGNRFHVAKNSCNISIHIEDPNIKLQSKPTHVDFDALPSQATPETINTSGFEPYSELLERHRNEVERVRSDISHVSLGTDAKVISGGRMHFVFSATSTERLSLMPVFFHLQYIWFFSDKFGKCASELHLRLWDDKRSLPGEKLLDVSEREVLFRDSINFTHATEALGMRNEFTKRSLEGVTESLYNAVDRKWRIETALVSLARYVRFFQGFVESEKMRIERAAERRLAAIGVFIALLGFISIVASVVGMLDILEKSPTPGKYWSAILSSSMATDGLALSIFVVLIGPIALALSRATKYVRRWRA